MLSSGAIYEVVDTQGFGLQEIKNIYHYVMTDVIGNPTLLDAILDFISAVVDIIKIVQSNDLTHTSVSMKDLSGGVDYREESISISGTGGIGDALPIHDAYSIKLSGSSLLTRPGGKRIAGALEADQLGGVSSIPVPTKQSIESALSTPIVVDDGLGNTALMTPVIIGRTITGALDLAKANVIIGAKFRDEITTQRTRKLSFTS